MSDESKSVLENLKDARESLLSAKRDAGLGTGLMIGSLLDELERLITRTKNINNGNEEHESQDGE